MFRLIVSVFFSIALLPLVAEIVAREGNGYLDRDEGQATLYVQGTPYEMGYQQGKLLKEAIQSNITTFIDNPLLQKQERYQSFLKVLPQIRAHVPSRFVDEMKGLAAGAEVPFEKVELLNLFPEMFHCSGMTFHGDASSNGELYHVRILDYRMGKGVQKTAVLILAKPDGYLPFANVTYAGFIGSVTGMNTAKVAIGEIGGHLYGEWNGMPMAFLMRDILERAHSLDAAKAILTGTPRTCEYYYVISDGNTRESIGVYATPSQIDFIAPGQTYALFEPRHLPPSHGEDKLIETDCVAETTPCQTLLFGSQQQLQVIARSQPKDCLLLTGFPYPERYPVLVERVLKNYGAIDAEHLIEIIDQPVSRDSNLHNVIFEPATLKMWIAHAGPNSEPACTQPYRVVSIDGLRACFKKDS